MSACRSHASHAGANGSVLTLIEKFCSIRCMRCVFSTDWLAILLLGTLFLPGVLGCARDRMASFGDRQTIPPPPTNSYLSQPSTPANPGTPSNPPPFIPSNAPLPSRTTDPGASTNTGGAVTFQAAQAAPPVAVLASSAIADRELPAQPTGQTAFQNLEARSHSRTRITDDGRSVTVTTDPHVPVASSSQIITHVSADE